MSAPPPGCPLPSPVARPRLPRRPYVPRPEIVPENTPPWRGLRYCARPPNSFCRKVPAESAAPVRRAVARSCTRPTACRVAPAALRDEPAIRARGASPGPGARRRDPAARARSASAPARARTEVCSRARNPAPLRLPCLLASSISGVCDEHSSSQRPQGHRGRGQRDPAAPYKFADAISDPVTLCGHRFAIGKTADVGRQAFHRGVAPRRFFAQRH